MAESIAESLSEEVGSEPAGSATTSDSDAGDIGEEEAECSHSGGSTAASTAEEDGAGDVGQEAAELSISRSITEEPEEPAFLPAEPIAGKPATAMSDGAASVPVPLSRSHSLTAPPLVEVLSRSHSLTAPPIVEVLPLSDGEAFLPPSQLARLQASDTPTRNPPSSPLTPRQKKSSRQLSGELKTIIRVRAVGFI